MRNVTLKGDIQIQELCIFWSFEKNFTFTGRKPLLNGISDAVSNNYRKLFKRKVSGSKIFLKYLYPLDGTH